MTTGKDIAKFVSMMTGDSSYEEMYDQGQEQQNMLKTEAVNQFKDMIDRIGMAERKKFNDFID